MAKSTESRTKGNNSFARYLPCRIEPGMFRGEYLVYLTGYSLENPGESIKVQMLVDQNEIEGIHGTPKRNQPANAWLKVTLAGEVKGHTKIILPQPAQPVGESLLVDSEDLRTKAGG